MKHQNSVRLVNASAGPLKVILEPYATEFLLPQGSTCEVIGKSEETEPELSLEYTAEAMVIWGISSQAVYEYWQDGQLVF